MRYGIVGTGRIAKAFIGGARAAAGADIRAVYSRTLESGGKFAEDNKIPEVFTDFGKFLRGDFDAAYVASPNALHYPQSRAALQNGKNVVCEKPVTVEPEELAELQSLARQKGLVYMEAIMYMHNPVRTLLRESLKKIGRITSARLDFSQLSSKYPAYLAGETPNIFNPKLAAGCLMDLGVYCVYPAVDLFGIPEDFTARSRFMRSGADACGCACFVYPDKCVALTYSKLGQSRLGSEILGDRGSVSIGSISKLTNIDMIDANGDIQAISGDIPKEELMGFEVLDFERFVSDPNDPYYAVTSERALQVSKLVKKIRDGSGIKFG